MFSEMMAMRSVSYLLRGSGRGDYIKHKPVQTRTSHQLQTSSSRESRLITHKTVLSLDHYHDTWMRSQLKALAWSTAYTYVW